MHVSACVYLVPLPPTHTNTQKWTNNNLHPLKGSFRRSWYTLYANSKLANLLFSMEVNRRLVHNEIMVRLWPSRSIANPVLASSE